MQETIRVNRLHPAELREMQVQFNCNLGESEDMETWLDQEDWPSHISILDEVEFFEAYIA